MKSRYLLCSAGLLLAASQLAPANFITNFAASDSSDFNMYTQIGSDGGTSTSPNTFYSSFNNSLTLASGYGAGNAAEAILNTSGPNGNGIYGNTYASLTYSYYNVNGASSNNPAGVALGLADRLNSNGTTTTADGTVTSASPSNTYPDYRVDLLGTTLTVSKDSGYQRGTTITSQSGLSLSGTDTYTLQFNTVTLPTDPGSNTAANHSAANDAGVLLTRS